MPGRTTDSSDLSCKARTDNRYKQAARLTDLAYIVAILDTIGLTWLAGLR